MGILAIAGGVAGAGQGLAETGREAQKVSLAEKVNALAQSREEAIERLRGAEQEKLQASSQSGQQALEKTRETFESGQTERRIGAASAAAGATRKFEEEQNKAKLESEEKRTSRTAESRENSALIRASASQGGKGSGKPPWEVHTVASSHIDPKLGPVQNQTQVLMNNKTGASYMQIGDKFVRYDAQKNAPAFDPKGLKRAPAADLQDLLKDPLGVVPAGTNQGMTKAEAFEQTHGYLPAQWTSAAQQAEQQQKGSSSSFSLPAGLVRGIGGPGATSTKTSSFGGAPQGDEDDGAENAAQSDEDASSAAPPFQSNAMGSYQNNMQ